MDNNPNFNSIMISSNRYQHNIDLWDIVCQYCHIKVINVIEVEAVAVRRMGEAVIATEIGVVMEIMVVTNWKI